MSQETKRISPKLLVASLAVPVVITALAIGDWASVAVLGLTLAFCGFLLHVLPDSAGGVELSKIEAIQKDLDETKARLNALFLKLGFAKAQR